MNNFSRVATALLLATSLFATSVPVIAQSVKVAAYCTNVRGLWTTVLPDFTFFGPVSK